HDGNMVQIGLNRGARHCRTSGYAVSFRAKLSDDTKASQDENVIGATSLFWRFVQRFMPVEVTRHVEEQIDMHEMPTMATSHVPSDIGFALELNEVEYRFSLAERGPPEAYLSRGYAAYVENST
ncbi:uncharacterized protein STEHIDRAFT_69024, partial [Stereum hirsutum FP-91666 SS1]